VKRAALISLVLAFTAAACGLKVPVTLVEGNTVQGPGGGDTSVDASGPKLDGSGPPGVVVGPSGIPLPSGSAVPTGGPLASIFPNETEGVTKTSIRLCAHVPITGAAPIPHAAARFGQFYFDWVNDNGGVYGRKVTFTAINDNYNPAGARNAVEQCSKSGAFIYYGAAGTDQIVSVAKWAERKQVPYLHGPTSDKDLGGLKYNVFAGPTYEFQHKLLAQYLVDRFGKDKNYITLKVDSPYFDAGADAFRAEMKRLGVTVKPDIKVQKDESNFGLLFNDLQDQDIDVVNNFTTPNVWIKMLKQKPATFDPWWTAVSPVAGFNIVAQALSGTGKAVVFHSFGPACDCATYKDEEISQHKDLAWYDDIQQFLRVFKQYSPEQDPPPDDFDYASFLSARAIHRLLLQTGPQPTRSKLWSLMTTYKETAKAAFPGCAADFTRNDKRMGAWNVNIFELRTGTWHQIAGCKDRV
jgi:hypothetical protein